MSKLTDRDQLFTAIKDRFGDIESITRAQLVELYDAKVIKWPAWFVKDESVRIGRGVYSLRDGATMPVPVVPSVAQDNSNAMAAMAVAAVQMNTYASIDLVPEKSKGYVPFGNFTDVRQIINSRKFYPMYVTGLSGNGKTMMIEQVCAAEKREMIRVNVTIETDEDDLLGGFRLVDGRTVWQNGPVIVAMERGAVLLIDEVDLGSNKLMCLQPVLEGKPVYLKKINKVITPMPGFNIVATANTKGKGSDDGRFIGTNIMNEAFLERFSITMEQEYPSIKTEEKILSNVLGASGIEDKDFVSKLVQWADVIRKSFYEGAVSEIISTRRLVHICEAFIIFGQKREKAIQLCLNRFDIDTKNSFLDLYKKLDETVNPIVTPAPVSTDEVGF
jgi:midasin (ATPase involved in ribosome maturation)